MTSDPLMLRISDLKQWAYCPRIVFFLYTMPVDKKPTYKMERGRAAEEAFDRLEKRRKLSEFGLSDGKRHFHYWCSDKRIGLSGVVDLLIESKEGLFPVDFKHSEQNVHQNHITQLAGYALLLERRFETTVSRGYIFLIPKDEIVTVEITTAIKEEALSLTQDVRSAIERQAIPEATQHLSKCDECEYRNYCGDVF